MALSNLFSPLEVGRVTLANRLALPATLTNYGRDHRVTDRWSSFLVERARGGTAMLVSEIIAVDPEALANPAIVNGFDDTNAPAFRATARAVRSAGSHLIGQLWHPGRQQLWHPTRAPMGVSGEPDAYSWTVPRVMSSEDIQRVARAYVDTATRLAECGFTGVELHGAHGYLITQFLSPWSNTRTDGYGGSLENRSRFVHEVANGIRARCGEEFIIGLKMPATEGVEGGIDPPMAAAITRHLRAGTPLDYFAYGQGNFSLSLEDHVPDMHYRPGHFIELHKAMRTAADGIPVMALGKIGTPELAERIVAEGFGDLVGMSRALVADAAFANKARTGRVAEIRPSTFNNFCWGEVHRGKPLAEFHNPLLATPGEADWRPRRCTTSRRIVIVGSGIGALECAWVAAARGHQVTLLGSSAEVGGKLRLEARLPGHADAARVYEHQHHMGREHGVTFELGRRKRWQEVAAMAPDVLVLATGAEMRQPEVFGGGTDPARSIHQLARDLARSGTSTSVEGIRSPGTALLFDFDHTAPTYAVAQHLADRFERLVLVTPRTQIAEGVNYCSAIGIHRRLYERDAILVPASRPVEVADSTVTVENVFSGKRTLFENVVERIYATPRRSLDPRLDGDFQAALSGIEIHAIGDCVSPRNALVAVHEGHALGNAL